MRDPGTISGVRRVEADAVVKQNYFRKRASAHTIGEEGQQHIAMADRKLIALSISYFGQLLDSIVTLHRKALS